MGKTWEILRKTIVNKPRKNEGKVIKIDKRWRKYSKKPLAPLSNKPPLKLRKFNKSPGAYWREYGIARGQFSTDLRDRTID